MFVTPPPDPNKWLNWQPKRPRPLGQQPTRAQAERAVGRALNDSEWERAREVLLIFPDRATKEDRHD